MKTFVRGAALFFAALLVMSAGQANFAVLASPDAGRNRPNDPSVPHGGSRLSPEIQNLTQNAFTTDSLALTQVQIGSANTTEKYRRNFH